MQAGPLSTGPALQFAGINSLAEQNHYNHAAHQQSPQQAPAADTTTEHAQHESGLGQQHLAQAAANARPPLSAWQQQDDEPMLQQPTPEPPSMQHDQQQQQHAISSKSAPQQSTQQLRPYQLQQPGSSHDSILSHHEEQAHDMLGLPSPRARGSQPREASAPPDHLQLPDANGQLEDEAQTGATRRRHPSIKSKSWAGSVVWAKLGDFPWWPAQV